MARWDNHDPRDPDRLWSKIDATGICWVWTATLATNGYGLVRWGGPYRRAHHAVWEALVGDLPEGLEPDHLCRNRACVNPDHLEWVTHRENTLRGNTLARQNAAITHCPQGHPYDEVNTYIHEGRRRCRVCRAARARRYRLGNTH